MSGRLAARLNRIRGVSHVHSGPTISGLQSRLSAGTNQTQLLFRVDRWARSPLAACDPLFTLCGPDRGAPRSANAASVSRLNLTRRWTACPCMTRTKQLVTSRARMTCAHCHSLLQARWSLHHRSNHPVQGSGFTRRNPASPWKRGLRQGVDTKDHQMNVDHDHRAPESPAQTHPSACIPTTCDGFQGKAIADSIAG